jgi:hypothetical protein
MTENDRRDLREYAWKYFALHADQRLRTFNFYLIIVAVVLGGILTFLKDAKVPALASPAGASLCLLSYIFWGLDRRNRELITHAMAILRTIENETPTENLPENLRVFVVQEQQTKAQFERLGQPHWKNPWLWIFGYYTYRHWLNLVFIVIGLLGALITVGVLFMPSSQPTSPPAPPVQNFYIGGAPVNPNPVGRP